VLGEGSDICGGGSGTGATENTLNAIATQQEGMQTTAGTTAIPLETSVAKGNIPNLSDLVSYGTGVTARSFAPTGAALARQMAQAGIDPNSPQGIALRSQLNESEGAAFDQTMASILQNATSEQLGGIQNLLELASGGNSALSALGLLANLQLNA
jgi:hypothetical protein